MEAHGASVSSLVIVIITAFLTPLLLHRFKLKVIPVVVAEIIMGLIIGKSGFNIVQEDMWLETLSTLGFIFLMFLSGLEIDFTAFSNKKKQQVNGKKEPNSFYVATIIFAFILILSIGLSYIFVWVGFIDNAFLMTIIISTISLGVVVPTLKEGNLMKTSIGQIILLIAVIADLVTMILLAVFASIYEGGDSNTWLLLILFAAGVLFYIVGRTFKGNKLVSALSTGTTQIGTRAIFTLIILLVAISETVGAENILGAFLAGVLVSLLAPDQELIHKLDSFGYGFLIPIFFVMIGVELDIWELFGDPKLLLLIPLLIIALLVSKLLPMVVLKVWYDWKTVLASSFLLTSTLSLVIAAATIGERMGIIDSQLSGTLILVAIITCIFTPIVFKRLMPREAHVNKKLKLSFIGANQLTLPLSREFDSAFYETTLYHTPQEKEQQTAANSLFQIEEIESFTIEALEKTDIFTSDIVVVSTGDEEINANLAKMLRDKGIERVIVRVERPEQEKELKDTGLEVFSVLKSSKALLRALIESPKVMNILTNEETALYEIHLQNESYDGMTLRRFPFTGDVIIVRIFRGTDSIVPNGDTELSVNDKLIVTGSPEYVDELRNELEFTW